MNASASIDERPVRRATPKFLDDQSHGSKSIKAKATAKKVLRGSAGVQRSSVGLRRGSLIARWTVDDLGSILIQHPGTGELPPSDLGAGLGWQ
jgi:hypothetical protein